MRLSWTTMQVRYFVRVPRGDRGAHGMTRPSHSTQPFLVPGKVQAVQVHISRRTSNVVLIVCSGPSPAICTAWNGVNTHSPTTVCPHAALLACHCVVCCLGQGRSGCLLLGPIPSSTVNNMLSDVTPEYRQPSKIRVPLLVRLVTYASDRCHSFQLQRRCRKQK